MENLKSSSAKRKRFCAAVLYLDTLEFGLLVSQEYFVYELKRGNVEEIFKNGVLRNALVLGTAGTPKEALRQAEESMSQQDPNFELSLQCLQIDEEMSHQDDKDEFQMESPQIDKAIGDENEVEVQSEEEEDKFGETLIAQPTSPESSSQESDVSDVEVYINGEPASHKLSTDEEDWEAVMKIKK